MSSSSSSTYEEVRANPGKVYLGLSRWGHIRYYTWGHSRMWVLEVDAGEKEQFALSVLPAEELMRMVYRPIRERVQSKKEEERV